MAARQRSVRRRARRPKPQPRRLLLKLALVALGATLLLGIAGATALAMIGWAVYHRNTDSLGDIQALLDQNYGPAKIYDRNGKLLYEFEDRQEGLHEKVSLSKVSPWLIKATIATEDASFYSKSNRGINIRGLLRAGIENFFPGKGGFLQGSGGSSITQQLVKNVLIPEEERYKRSVDRKVKEATLAIELTRRYSKDQILEWYLNQIYYGNRAYGIGAAAQRYFGISAAELNLAQAALLAGIPQAPVAYDPILNFDNAKARQADVLRLMVKHGAITEAQAEEARNATLTFVERGTVRDIRAPHWVFYIQDLLIRRYGEAQVYRGGLRVTTTLDLDLQEKGQEIVDKWVTEFERQNCGCHNGALTAIDNNTGQILVMVGSRDFFRKDIQGENNNATAIKQPGSAFKPAVYLAAFLKGWSPSTIVWDVPKKYPNPGGEPFVPVGPTKEYNGPLTVRQALGSSLNAPAVAAAAYAGVPQVIDTAHKLGISTLTDPENYGVSIATGGANITLLDMTYMYSTIANNGMMVGESAAEGSPRRLNPVALLKVVDGRGRTLYEFKEPRREQTVPAQHVYLITNVLSDDSARTLIYSPGLFNLRDGRPLAAKTGTQQGYEVSQIRSTWNFGYIPDLSVGVWVGNADGTLVRNISSASSSLRIWRDFMQYAVDYLRIPPKPFPQPPGIVRAKVTVPGAQGCREIEDLFVKERAPTPTPTVTPIGSPTAGAITATGSGACRTVKIDTRNGLLATAETPAEFVQEVTFVDMPPDIEGWTPGPHLKAGVPPSATSTATPAPTRAPTLPPRVVTPPAVVGSTTATPPRPGSTPTPTPMATPTPSITVTQPTPARTPGPPFFTPVPPGR